MASEQDTDPTLTRELAEINVMVQLGDAKPETAKVLRAEALHRYRLRKVARESLKTNAH